MTAPAPVDLAEMAPSLRADMPQILRNLVTHPAIVASDTKMLPAWLKAAAAEIEHLRGELERAHLAGRAEDRSAASFTEGAKTMREDIALIFAQGWDPARPADAIRALSLPPMRKKPA